jgi:hypothetical protein
MSALEPRFYLSIFKMYVLPWLKGTFRGKEVARGSFVDGFAVFTK